MAVLHVRDIPEALYERMQRIARSHGRTLSAEVIALFEQAVQRERARREQARLLRRIRQDRWTPPPGTPDAAELLRQVRDERDAPRNH